MTVTLSSGDVLRGVLESAPDADPVVLAHPLFGRMSVSRAMIKSVEPVPIAPQPPAPEAAPAPAPPPPADPPTPPTPPTPPAAPPTPAAVPEAIPEIGFFDKWTGTVESGFNIASGSADRMNLRFAMSLRRETPETITTTNAAYNYGNDNHGVSENRARLDVRNDWLQQKDSGWRYFAAFSGEYDTYQEWDWRLTGSLGLGYDLVKEADFTLIARAGLGASRELGRVDNTIRPEFTPGFDLEYKLDDRSKIIGSFDAYRDLDQFDIYRFVARAAYEVLIDQKNNLVLRLGIEDRYDDSVGYPRENNDVEIFTSLVFKF
jgi:putative salt-induced outer membrane protein YdiY